MSSSHRLPDIMQIIANAEKLHANLYDQISIGNEQETDSLSKLYEGALAEVFDFQCETKADFSAKLAFSHKLLAFDHPMETFIAQVFQSLASDVELLF